MLEKEDYQRRSVAMHEIAAMQQTIRTVLACMQQAGASRVTHVQLALGVCGHLTAEAAHQSFEMLIKGTPIEGASLAIQWLPARYQCLSCWHHFESGEPGEQALCPQCSEVALEVAHQEICAVRSIDVSFPAVCETVGHSQLAQKPWPVPISLIASECALIRR
jgi:hydrogenase nickel incorporation protein HypA/HybF